MADDTTLFDATRNAAELGGHVPLYMASADINADQTLTSFGGDTIMGPTVNVPAGSGKTTVGDIKPDLTALIVGIAILGAIYFFLIKK